jgi:hypothetical protein
MLLDERIDISGTKILGVVIRYYSQSKQCIVDTYLDLVELASCTADSICELLNSCITTLANIKVGLSLSSVGSILCSCRMVSMEFGISY